MPNWCECDLKVSGPKNELRRFKAFSKVGNLILALTKYDPYPKRFRLLDLKAENQKCRRDQLQTNLINKGSTVEESRQKALLSFPYIEAERDIDRSAWCHEHWGTSRYYVKLFGEVANEHDSDGVLIYTLCAAWGTPCPLILKMGEKFKQLRFYFTYYESGFEFAGIYAVEHGKAVLDQSFEYKGVRGG